MPVHSNICMYVHPIMQAHARTFMKFFTLHKHEVVRLKQKYKIKLINIARILLIIIIIIKSKK